MQTALHIKNLVAELTAERVDSAIIVNTAFYKKERTAYFYLKIKGKSLMALVFSYHPAGFGFYYVPASKVDIKTREKPWPIFGLDGSGVTAFEQWGFDRLVKMSTLKDGRRQTVIFEALGVNGNIWLTDESSILQATLRNRKYTAGDRYQPPPPLEGLNPFKVTSSGLEKIINKSDKPMTTAILLEKNILGFNRTLAVETARRTGLDQADIRSFDSRALEILAEEVRGVAGHFDGVSPGYLYEVRHSPEVYPFRLKSVDGEPEKFKTLSLAVMAMASHRQVSVEEADEEKKIIKVVEQAARRLQKRLLKLEQDLKEAGSYEIYRKMGELLKINMDTLRKGMTEVTVKDVFSEPHKPLRIELDRALSPQENIESYFKKFRKGREGGELLKRRLEITQNEYEEILKILTDLEFNFNLARERYRSEINSLLPKAGAREVTAPRLPYKEYQLSTGLTIFVGRDGSDNDRTTFDYAKPYELWFHTQQCPGSHVVMKYPNKSFEPSKREIEETAAIAAFHSKARNDSLVPVVYTERKYVRKPKKAKPGLVMVEREKSIMVVPKKPE